MRFYSTYCKIPREVQELTEIQAINKSLWQKTLSYTKLI